MIWTLIQYVLKAAYTDKLPLIFVVVVAVSLSGALFMGGGAVTEQDQFVLTFAANSFRLLGVLLTIFYVHHYFTRAFQTQEISAMLTKPFTRLDYLLGHYAAFQIIILLFTLTVAALFTLFFQSGLNDFLFWIVGFWAELSLMALIALFFALLLPHGFWGGIASVGLYILGRLSGSFLLITQSTDKTSIVGSLGESIVEIILIFVPRFDLFVQSHWLLYDQGTASISYYIPFHFVTFTGLILSAAYFDLCRKEF